MQWYIKFDNFMMRSASMRCVMDQCCYIKHFDFLYIILFLFVNDTLIAGSDMRELDKLKN